MITRARTLLAAVCTLVPATAFAHPGHGHTDPDSLAHYLTEPVHAIPLALAAAFVIIAVAGWRIRARRMREQARPRSSLAR